MIKIFKIEKTIVQTFYVEASSEEDARKILAQEKPKPHSESAYLSNLKELKKTA